MAAGELLRFVAYELFLAGLPGVLLYRALASRPGGLLRHVAIGWPIGYALELGIFALTAGTGARDLLPVIQLGVAALGLAILWRRGSQFRGLTARSADGEDSVALTPAAVWTVAGVIIVALGSVAIGYFTQTPLPGDVGSVSYSPDSTFDLGLIAEAKNHWPMQDPHVTGVSLRYHIYSFLHMASVSQVTGIEPSTLLFRLFPAGLIALIALQVVELGRRIGRSAWVGPLAAGLVLLVGELDLEPERPTPLGNAFFENLFLSPSFLFGIPFFLAAVTLMVTFLRSRDSLGRGDMALLGILLLGAGGAKATVIPVVLGGLAVWGAWSWLMTRAIPRAAWTAFGVGIFAYLVSYFLLFAGGADGGLTAGLFGFTDFTVVWELADPASRSPLVEAVCTVVTGVIGLLGILLSTLGIAWVLKEQKLKLEPGQAFLLSLLVAAAAAFSIVEGAGNSQSYILHYGLIAGCVLSAEGILLFLARARQGWERPERAIGALLACAILAGGVAATVLYVEGLATADEKRLLIGYGIAFGAVAVLALIAGFSARRRVAGLTAGVALFLTISLGLLNTPLDETVPLVEKVKAEGPVYPRDSVERRGMTDQIYQGLRWLRDHSDTEALFAVNNHALDPSGNDSRYFYYTAFSERRAFLESWQYTTETAEIGFDTVAEGEQIPYPQVRALNSAVFERADPAAIRKLHDGYGVDFLVVDKIHGRGSPKLAKVAGRPVFENRTIAIYKVM